MTTPCAHLVLIPSYNTGAKLLDTVREARRYWQPVWIVIDGSTDGSGEALQALAAGDPGLKVLVLPHNQGKGAAILHGLRAAAAAGYTHVLTMDADGQHPTDKIAVFMAVSRAHPQAVILGRPVFDASAPAVRVHGRKLSNGLANLQTLWHGIGDALYGFRVYPVEPLRELIDDTALIAHQLYGVHDEIPVQIIEPVVAANNVPQADQIAGLGPAADVAGKSAVHRHGLCRVFDAAHGRQLPASAQRVFRIPVGPAHATDVRRIPLQHAIEQAHRPGVRNQPRDVGLGH